MKDKIKVAICIDKEDRLHSANWYYPWEEFCEENKLEYEILNPYSNDIIKRLKGFNILLWHFSGYNFKDMLMARNVLFSAKKMGLKVFPDIDDSWHFDDKVAETYLLEAIDAPIPKSYVFYNLETINNFIKNDSKFPLIAKLRNGSGSHNVKMISSENQLYKYAKIMFTKGFNSSPSLLYKTTSNVKSSKSISTFIKRLKRAPEFLKTLRYSKMFPNEKGYVFLQEFIPNDGYDLKIVVVGNKLSFIARNIRKGDFRASGGGDLFFDKKLVTEDVIKSAFETSDKLGFKCMGYDYVVNNETGKGIIIEISYGFSHEALLQANGYFDREGKWYDEPLNAPKELLNNLIHV